MSEEICVQVALRIRPLVPNEISRGCQQCIEKVPGEPQVIVRGDRHFTYNYVFDATDSQEDVYERSVKVLVNKLFKGYNVTILAYGQTGSGKTFSMGTCCAEDGDVGIIPRAIEDIFNTVSKTKDSEFKIHVSFTELHKEQLFDLLAEQRCPVDVREDNKEIHIPNLTEVLVNSTDELRNCLTRGSEKRATGATAMNSQSSRSHAIFTIKIHQQSLLDENEATTAKFHLVDLAGSERSKKTMATGERFKEGVNINRGLLALGNVISALGEEGQKGFITYRDSKLTRLLQDSLGGNSITLMIACVSPADYNLEETVSTLRYADRARRIKNKPIVNQDPILAELARYKHQVKELQLQLLTSNGSGGSCPASHQKLVEENAFLCAKIRKQQESLNNALVESASQSELAMTAERSRKIMKTKLCDLRSKFVQTVGVLNRADKELLTPEVRAALEDVNTHCDTIHDLEADQKRCCEEILKKELSHNSFNIKMEANNENDTMSSTADMDLRHEEHTTQQQELNKELQELNHELALKEQLASEMAKSTNGLQNIQPVPESIIKEFQEQIESLQRDKDKLIVDLKNSQHNSQQNNNCSKLAEQRRKQVQECDHKMSDLKKKIIEQAKIVKVKEQNDKKIVQLNKDIESMKHAKVRLVRQMRNENERFREWQKERKREISKLMDQDQKRKNQMMIMERKYTKEQNVLKRKCENAAAANKRLMDALAVQKSAQERRLNQGNGTAISRLQTFLNQEMEVVISRFEAERTLNHLLEDRALLHNQRTSLQNNLEENNLTESEINELTNEIKQLTEDIDIRNMQIEDLQQKLVNTDQDSKYKGKWDCLQSMAEAKAAVKYLFELAIDAKREVSTKDYKLEELQDAHRQAVTKLEHHEQKLREMSLKHQQELVSIEKDHQDKVLVLLRQLRGVEGSHLAESLHVLIQGLEENDLLKEQLEARDSEVLALRNQLSASNKSGRPSLFPIAVPLKATKSKKSKSVLLNFSEDEEEEKYEDDTDKDPDWRKTPIFRRIQKMKNRSDDKSEIRQAVKRTSDGQSRCTCKTACRSRICGCRKVGSICGPECKCDRNVCENQQESTLAKILDFENDTTGSDENQSDEGVFKKPSNEESSKKPRFEPLQESNRLTY